MIARTQICQNSPVARTSRTNTDNPAGCMEEDPGGRVRKGENRLIEGLSRGTRRDADVLYNPQRFRVGNGVGCDSITEVGDWATVSRTGYSREIRDIYIRRRRTHASSRDPRWPRSDRAVGICAPSLRIPRHLSPFACTRCKPHGQLPAGSEVRPAYE